MPSVWLPLLVLALLAFAGVRAMTLHVDLTKPAAVPVASVTVILTAQTSTTFSLAAIVADASGNQLLGRTVTWSSSNTSIAIVDGAGLVSEGGTAGTATITATCEGITGTMTVTVSVPASVATSLVWQDSAPAFTAFGQTAYSRAVVKDQYGVAMSPQPTITYTSGTPADVTIGSSTGLCTAVANGSSVITAQVTGTVGNVVNPSITQTATVSQVVTSITGVSSTLSTTDTASGTFSPVGKDANNTTVSGATFAYSSDTPSVITVNASSGAWAAQSAGTATITLTANPGGFVYSVAVTVTQTPTTVTVSPSSFSIAVSATQQLTAVVKDALGVTISGATVTWSSSDTSKATVSSTGLVTGVAAGSVTITATDGSASGTSAGTVTSGTATLVLTKGGTPIASSFTSTTGNTPSLAYQYADGAHLSTAPGTDIFSRLVWATNNGTVVAVDEPEIIGGGTAVTGEPGLARGYLKQGQTVTLTVPCVNPANVTGVSANTGLSAGTITVVDASHVSFPLTAASNAPLHLQPRYQLGTLYLQGGTHGDSTTGVGIEVYPSALTIPTTPLTVTTGNTLQLAATDTATSTDITSVYPYTNWTSSNTAVATVDQFTGLVHGVAAGTATITVTFKASDGTTIASTTATVTVQSLTSAKTRIDSDAKYSAGGGAALASKALNVAAGDLLVVGVSNKLGTTGYNGFTITDTAGNTYTRAGVNDDGTNVEALYYAKNAIANANTVITVTCTSDPADNNPYLGIGVAQYRNASTTAPLESTPVATYATAASVTSPTFSTTDANDLVVALVRGAGAGTLAMSGGPTLRADTGEVVGIADWMPGSVQTNVTIGASSAGASLMGLIVGVFQ